MDQDAFDALTGTEDGRRALTAAHAALAGSDDPVELTDRLRRSFPAGLTAAALTQAGLRRRAAAKFGTTAERMYFTPAGLEQSTRSAVAELHARRYAAAGIRRVADLGCGIGGDMIALARAGLTVLAIEQDPLTAAVAAANAAALGLADRVEVRRADITTLDLTRLDVDAVFCDPARRTEQGRRIFDPDGYQPPWSFLRELPARIPATGVKVAPGIPHQLVPTTAEAEWVSDHGEVKEAALWFGPLRSGAARRATVLPAGASLADPAPADGEPADGAAADGAAADGAAADCAAADGGAADGGAADGAAAADDGPVDGRAADPPAIGPVANYLYEPDGAVIRAHLVARLATEIGAHLIDPRLAYLSADTPVRSPFVAGYRVREVLPFQLKRLRAALRERDIGAVTIKKRGSALDPDQLRRQLRLAGTGSIVVILTRICGRPIVILADPMPARI
ncbi:MAG TPA: class I SAM-dependent methyltransferase [Actinomycetes bacterium]|nr:class I SAM-dependent methyltransferase [Actinomycetes bacterium]